MAVLSTYSTSRISNRRLLLKHENRPKVGQLRAPAQRSGRRPASTLGARAGPLVLLGLLSAGAITFCSVVAAACADLGRGWPGRSGAQAQSVAVCPLQFVVVMSSVLMRQAFAGVTFSSGEERRARFPGGWSPSPHCNVTVYPVMLTEVLF